MSCLRWEHFTRLLMKSITKLITSSPGPRAPERQLAEALPGCVVAWGASLLEESPPPPSVSSTSSTPSSWPRSRFSACSTTATRRTSAGLASCTSGSPSRPPWCGTGSSPTWTMKRYVASRLCGGRLQVAMLPCWASDRGEYWCVPGTLCWATHQTVLGVSRQSPAQPSLASSHRGSVLSQETMGNSGIKRLKMRGFFVRL